jgi:hypothetical protein
MVMKISFVTHWCRRLVSVGASALLLTALGVMPAHAISTEGFFELDGNVADPSGAASPDDWASFYVVPSQGHTTQTSGITPDTTPSVFRGSKDTQDVSSWRYDLGSSPPKDDLVHAYAAAYTATATSGSTTAGDLLIYFGANRASFNGTASLGFWFFKNPIALDNANGRFINPNTNAPATHAEGDALIAFEYTNGGAVTGVRIFRWTSGQLAESGSIGIAPTTNPIVFCDPSNTVCGTNNNIPLSLPWAGDIQPGQFFEGGINLSKIFTGGDTCFAGFMATTRTSDTANATIKNFILGNFPVCHLTVTKSCESAVYQAANNNVLNTVVGRVLNDGGGLLTSISLVDNPAFGSAPSFYTCTIGGLPTTTPKLPGSLAAGDSICYRATQISNTLSTSDTVMASASAGSSTISGTATATCVASPPASGLSVTKICDVDLVADNSKLALKVNYSGSVTNTGGVSLTNVIVCEAHEQTYGAGQTPCDVPHITHNIGTLASGAVAAYSGSYFPSVALGTSIAPATPMTNPADAMFKDQASAQGNLPVILNGGVVKAVAVEAACPLCAPH